MPNANLSLAHRYVEQFLGEGRLEVGDIAGMVASGTAFDPDLIAEHYWALHRGGPGASAEIVHDGSGIPA